METFTEDPILEQISNSIRKGIPVGFMEAIAAIDYQERKNEHIRQNKWWRKALRKLRIMK